MNISHILCVAAAAVCLSCTRDVSAPGGESSGNAVPESVDADNVVRGWVRIKLSDDRARSLRTGEFTRGEANSGDPDIDAIAAELGATEIRRVFSDGGRFAERRRRYGLHLWYDVRFDPQVPVSRASGAFSALEGIQYVEPIYRKRPLAYDAVPAEAVYPGISLLEGELPFNDPRLSDQWHYHNDGTIKGSSAGADMNLFEGWKTSTGNQAVIVAVTDSGVQFDHEDLVGAMWVNEAELNKVEGDDDDDNGYIDDIYGWNYVSGSAVIVPEDHGTHVAGTIAAVNGNGIGVCGVAGGSGKGDGARIMTLQVFEGNETVGDNDADGYVYAADNGAVISQNSWTWLSLAALPRSYSEAFDYFINEAGTDENGNQTGPMRGGIIICAAGNSGGAIEFPAADPRTLCVTAMGTSFNLESYSNRGSEADIMAPGGVRNDANPYRRRVLSTAAGNSYKYLYGTSMACPHVSGMAALIISRYGVGREGFTAEECREILLRAYRPMGGLVDDKYIDQIGVGLLDAGAAFVEDPATAPGAVAAPEASAELNRVTMSWIVPSDGNGNAVSSFEVTCTSDKGGVELSETFPNPYDTGSRAQYTFTGRYNTVYDVNVISVDRFGNRSEAVSFSAAVGNFVNRSPGRTNEKLTDARLPDTSEESVLRISLSKYFTDPDMEYGDVLSYSAVSSQENVVDAGIEGDVLVLTPLMKGTSLITVTASDLAGESIAATMYATVVGGEEPAGETEISVYPNPVADLMSIALPGVGGEIAVTVYDAAARKVLETSVELVGGEGVLNVGHLVPGVYSLAVSTGGSTVRTSFVKR